MADLWTDLLSCLELHPSAAATGTLATFEGPNQQLEYHRLFGGQLLAQFLRAADLACPDKAVKSVHVLFAREGKSDVPVRYVVQVQHARRSFATLAITARQNGDVIATAAVSMHAAEDGPQLQTVDAVPPVLDDTHRVRLDLVPWETRAAGDLDAHTSEAPDYDLWSRTPEVPVEYSQALISYLSDLNLIGTALRPLEGYGQRGNGTAFTSATTSHTLWFHRPFRADEWLLLRHHSPIVAHGRCWGRGDVLTADGTLVASFAQEALLRFRP